MNPMPPVRLSRTEPEIDIDARILLVEGRLIAREENFRRGLHAFGRRMGHALEQPRRLAKPALIAAAGVALLMLWRRPAAHPAPAQVAKAAARPAVFALLASVPWPRLVGMAWPMLPERWRRRASPATVSSLVGLALPLLGSLFTPRPRVPTADDDAR